MALRSNCHITPQNRLVHHSTGLEYFDIQVIYRASDSALFFFIIVIGHVVLTDVKDSMLDEGVLIL